jgi:DNA repair protein RadC
MTTLPSVPFHHGHRQRLKDRFLQTNGLGFSDYELLELLLFQVAPRKDVRDLAKTLMHTFGSLNNVVTAPTHRLLEIPGLGQQSVTALRVVWEVSKRLGQEQVIQHNIISSWNDLITYCRTSMAYNPIEEFRLLFLNSQNNLVADEVQQQGTVNHTPVYAREVVKRALQLESSALIMVHNHPSGKTNPSPSDIKITTQIKHALEAVDIKLHDHIIIGKSNYFSFKNTGLI